MGGAKRENTHHDVVCVGYLFTPESPSERLPVRSSTLAVSSSELDAMRRALTIAKKGALNGGNPRVGCVLLDSEGSAVAEGFHRGAGHPHAEVEALIAMKNAGLNALGLTAVVTLEPCNHHGKTGPCTQALIDAGISRVVFGASDPGEDSSGGEEVLRSAGIDVTGGVLGEESLELNEHWFFATEHGRPFVAAKWAQSLDGRHAAADGSSQWITGEASRARVHKQRSEFGAIAVGTSTALIDNPSLTAREGDGLYDSQPLAVVIGEREIPGDARVRSHPGGFTQIRSHAPADVLSELFDQGVRSVYVEGGATVVSSFIEEDLVDEFHITMGPLLLGGPKVAVSDIGVQSMLQAKELTITSVEQLGGDVWVTAVPARRRKDGV